MCAAVARHRVELLPATPSFLTLLMAANAHRNHDLSSLTRITYGTEVMPQTTLDRVRAAFPGVVLQQTYGLSEVGVLRSQSREDGSLWVRIGGEGFATKVVDDILWIKSSYAMLGYINAPSPFDDALFGGPLPEPMLPELGAVRVGWRCVRGAVGGRASGARWLPLAVGRRVSWLAAVD